MNAVVKVLGKSPRPNVRPDPDYMTLTTRLHITGTDQEGPERQARQNLAPRSI